jgi:hypothetical protein
MQEGRRARYAGCVGTYVSMNHCAKWVKMGPWTFNPKLSKDVMQCGFIFRVRIYLLQKCAAAMSWEVSC